MNILLLYNIFDGANGSFQVFQEEIVEAVAKYDNVYVSHDVSDTLRICKEINIDFSIGIGMFNQYINKCPIYDIVKVRHYQWVIDSPLKMDIDTESNGVTYICINKIIVCIFICNHIYRILENCFKCKSCKVLTILCLDVILQKICF